LPERYLPQLWHLLHLCIIPAPHDKGSDLMFLFP